jgi:hypothetical protein
MKQVSDEQIIGDAVRLVEEGMAVTLLVKGRSMLPFILGGIESAVLTKPGEVKEGDVVLARIDGRRYVLHRVMEVSGRRFAGWKMCWPGLTRLWGLMGGIGGSTRRGCGGGRGSGGGCFR